MHFALFHTYRKVFVQYKFVLLYILLYDIVHFSGTLFGTLIHNFHIVHFHSFRIVYTADNFHIDVTFDMSPDTYSRMPFGNSPDTDLLLPSPIKLVRRYIP